MINWTDCGIVLASRKHGEKYKIVDIFTKLHGKVSAMHSLSKAASFSVFSNVEVEYSSKLDVSLGFWKLKSEKQTWIFFINSFSYMKICQSMAFILNKVLPQGVTHERLFDLVLYILNNLKTFPQDKLLTLYGYFEHILLREIGFETNLINDFDINCDSMQSQIASLLTKNILAADLAKSLEYNHRVIETHLLDIDNYYRLSIINELKHSAG